MKECGCCVQVQHQYLKASEHAYKVIFRQYMLPDNYFCRNKGERMFALYFRCYILQKLNWKLIKKEMNI